MIQPSRITSIHFQLHFGLEHGTHGLAVIMYTKLFSATSRYFFEAVSARFSVDAAVANQLHHIKSNFNFIGN